MEVCVLDSLKYYLGYETLYDYLDVRGTFDKTQYLMVMHMVAQKRVGYMYSPKDIAKMIHDTVTYTNVHSEIEEIIMESATQKYNTVYRYFCK